MFLNNKEITTRISSGRNIADRIATEIVEERGSLITSRTRDVSRIPIEEQEAVIGLAEVVSGREVGRILGVSDKSVRNIKEREAAKGFDIDDIMEPVRRLAVDRISAALGRVTDEKLQDLSAKSLSEVARNVSSVVRNTAPRESKDGDSSRYQLTVIAPAAKKIAMFEVADA